MTKKSQIECTQPFDIAIIGGGIAGAAIARDAALRGASVVLFEKNTFGSGTSSKSSQLIHGGLRYLEVAWQDLKRGDFKSFWKNFRFVFLALRETHILHSLVPDLIHPIPLLIPIYKNRKRSELSVYFGTLLYGLLSKLSGGYLSKPLWTKEDVLKIIPALKSEGLTGGVIIWDHQTDDRKLVRAVMESALRSGTVAYENAFVARYHFNLQRKIYEIAVSVGGVFQSFTARKLINASGAWVDQVRESAHERREDLILPVSGAHLNLKKFLDTSVILEAEDGRLFFVIVREKDVRVGTTERLHFNPDQVEATSDEIRYLLHSVQNFFPGTSISSQDILQTDAGIRPLAKPQGSLLPNQVSREHVFTAGPTGAIHVLGVKLTDHRRAAEELLNDLAPEIRQWNPNFNPRSQTKEQPL